MIKRPDDKNSTKKKWGRWHVMFFDCQWWTDFVIKDDGLIDHIKPSIQIVRPQNPQFTDLAPSREKREINPWYTPSSSNNNNNNKGLAYAH